MLNFTNNIAQYTTSTRTAHTSAFTQFASKKQLASANLLNAQALAFLMQIKNTFTFAVHNDLRYVAITMYYSSAKSYGFLVVDLEQQAIAEVDSIKTAKAEIMELVNAQNA